MQRTPRVRSVGIYKLNTVCNYDPAIIPLLDAPYGSAFGRVPDTDRFEPEELETDND